MSTQFGGMEPQKYISDGVTVYSRVCVEKKGDQVTINYFAKTEKSEYVEYRQGKILEAFIHQNRVMLQRRFKRIPSAIDFILSNSRNKSAGREYIKIDFSAADTDIEIGQNKVKFQYRTMEISPKKKAELEDKANRIAQVKAKKASMRQSDFTSPGKHAAYDAEWRRYMNCEL